MVYLETLQDNSKKEDNMTTEQWHADITITEQLVKECIESQFPTLAPIHEIKCLGEGWDNTVYLINHKVIFRFPRRKIAVDLIARENSVLENLQGKLNLTIPNPVFRGQPSTHYPYPFHGYEMIKGVSGCEAQLSHEALLKSLPVLATFLKQLHSNLAEKASQMGASLQVYDRTNVSLTIPALTERVDKINSRKIANINLEVFQSETSIAQKLVLPENHCLIHGDLYCRHLLFDEEKLSAVIDWGDVGINSPAVDLAVIWSFYPESSHPHFFDVYGEVEQATWQYARFLGIYSGLTLILYAHDTQNQKLFTAAINSVLGINSNLLDQV